MRGSGSSAETDDVDALQVGTQGECSGSIRRQPAALPELASKTTLVPERVSPTPGPASSSTLKQGYSHASASEVRTSTSCGLELFSACIRLRRAASLISQYALARSSPLGANAPDRSALPPPPLTDRQWGCARDRRVWMRIQSERCVVYTRPTPRVHVKRELARKPNIDPNSRGPGFSQTCRGGARWARTS